MPTDLLAQAGAGIAAIAALGTAASGLVDSTKAFGGGVSRFGFAHIQAALQPFDAALTQAGAVWPRTVRTGVFRAKPKPGATANWREAVRANWINGRPKPDQKAAVKALIHVGLTPATAPIVAPAGHVNAAILTAAATAIAAGSPPSPTSDQGNILIQFDAAIDAAMDGAFERADQQYRNIAKLCAGGFAVILAIFGGVVVAAEAKGGPNTLSLEFICAYIGTANFWTAVLVGVIAVPLAPMAKDLTSSLQAAATALKATKP